VVRSVLFFSVSPASSFQGGELPKKKHDSSLEDGHDPALDEMDFSIPEEGEEDEELSLEGETEPRVKAEEEEENNIPESIKVRKHVADDSDEDQASNRAAQSAGGSSKQG